MLECNWQAFKRDASNYGTIGKTLLQLSNLEFAHDEFLMAFNERWPEHATNISSTFPRQFKEKTDFLVEAVLRTPLLRTMPIGRDGSLDLSWLQYQLDELYGMRPVLAHGSNSVRHETEAGISWYFFRYEKKGKGHWAKSRTIVGEGHLARMSETARALSSYLHNLRRLIRKEGGWEELYKNDILTRDNRRQLPQLLSDDFLEENPEIAALINIDAR